HRPLRLRHDESPRSSRPTQCAGADRQPHAPPPPDLFRCSFWPTPRSHRQQRAIGHRGSRWLGGQNTAIESRKFNIARKGGIRMTQKLDLLSVQQVEQAILFIRGQRVMLDADLAQLYGVSTKALNQAVKRNRNRFPQDFMFKLTPTEKAEVVTNCD